MFKLRTPMIVLLGVAALSFLVACAAPAREEPAPQPTQESSSPTAVPPTVTPEAPPSSVEPASTLPAETRDDSAVSGASRIPGNSLRVVSFNTHLLSPIFQCGAPTPFNEQCFVLNPLGETTAAHAKLIASALASGYFDVVAFNEVWDEDDGKDVLVDKLEGTYPHWIRYVDVFGGGFEEDSGLMLFSKLSFEPLPDKSYVSEDNETSYGDDSELVAYTKFGACAGVDCLAAKGAILVRLRHPGSGRIINVAVTHPQADYADEDHSFTRSLQFNQIVVENPANWTDPTLIETTLAPAAAPYSLFNWPNEEWIFLMGDLNVNGRGAIGNALYPAEAPTMGLSIEELMEWRATFGLPANLADTTGYPLYDAWAETTSEKDVGITHGYDPGERLDYILASRRTSLSGPESPPDLCVQHAWIPPELEGLSDHKAVAADLNLEAEQCNPRLAYEPTLEQMGVMTSAQEMEATLLGGKITYPGSMQWWRLGDTGTYSIAFDPNAAEKGVRFEVYAADDLSHPLGGSYWVDKNKILVCTSPTSADPEKRDRRQECWWAESETLVFPENVYIRVFADDRTWTGDYWIAFHQHACKTKEDACALLPNSPIPFDFPEKKPLNQEDGAWFRIDIREQADSGARQDLYFYARSRVDTWTPPKLVIFDKGGINDLSKIDGEQIVPSLATITLPGTNPNLVYQSSTAANEVLYMRIFRNDVNQTLPLTVGWRTNLTLLGSSQLGAVAMLVCQDETNPEDGHDEIALQVDIDGMGWQDRGYDTFDCNDSSDDREWDILGTMRFLQQVQIRLIERDSGTDEDDETAPFVHGALGWEYTISEPYRADHIFSWEGGDYILSFNVSKWVVK